MSIGPQIAWDDTVLPFQLDNADVRGRVVRLDGVLASILERRNYPPLIEQLVVEATLLSALIGQAIKLRWKLSLQVRGSGPIRILATDFYAPKADGEPATLRTYASYDEGRLDPQRDPFSQIGQGYFAVLIDQGAGQVPYQGMTPLSGGSLAACAETYFAQSEQLPTKFTLSYGQSQLPGKASQWRAGGVMLQHMPTSLPNLGDNEEVAREGGLLSSEDILSGADLENWQRVGMLADTLEALELIGPTVTPPDLLWRLFNDEAPRVFDGQSVRFGCSCSGERVRESLSIYSSKDIAQMTTPEGLVTADCQFCGAHYEFDPQGLGFEAPNA